MFVTTISGTSTEGTGMVMELPTAWNGGLLIGEWWSGGYFFGAGFRSGGGCGVEAAIFCHPF
jgi:hypothetical protein